MTSMNVIYQGDLRTQITHISSHTKLITDAPLDNQGKGESFSPTDLMSSSLGSCMLTIMGIKARTLGIDIDDTEVSIEKIMTKAPPRKVAEIVVRFNWKGKTFAPDIFKQLKDAALTCPVALSLHPDIKKNIIF